MPFPALFIAMFTMSPAAAQVVRGSIVDAGSGAPVASAEVLLLSEAGSVVLTVTTDSAGRFELPAPRAGTWSLSVARLGVEPLRTEPFRIGVGETLEVRLGTGAEAVPLAPLEIVARRSTGSHDAFRRRLEWGRRSGFGRFLTREELEEIASPRISTVLATMPGVAVRADALGRLRIGTSWTAVGDCESALLINGVRVTRSQSFPLDEMFSPEEIEGIEVYRNANEIPPELGVRGVCSAVVLWTRPPTPHGGGSLAFRILAGAVLGAGMLTLFFAR